MSEVKAIAGDVFLWGCLILVKSVLGEEEYCDFVGNLPAGGIFKNDSPSLIRRADALAGGGEGKGLVSKDASPEDPLPVPELSVDKAMESIFSLIYLSFDDFPIPNRYLHPTASGEKIVYPTRDEKLEGHREYGDWRIALWMDVQKIVESRYGAPPDQLSVPFWQAFLEKYGAFFPAGADRDHLRGISLYDHLKSAAAIASCLTLSDRFCLVGGDWSGIQEFVYTISPGGALKTLRARSFYLELLTEHVIGEILDRIGLSRANILSSAGGKFHLLLPGTESALGCAKEVQRSINEFLFLHYEERLYLALEGVAVMEEDLQPGRISIKHRELEERLERAKEEKFRDRLEQVFETREPLVDEAGNFQECDICRIDRKGVEIAPFEKDSTRMTCPLCRNLLHVGDDLTDFSYILKVPAQSSDEKWDHHYLSLPIPGGGEAHYLVWSDADHDPPPEKVWLKMKGWDCLDQYRELKTKGIEEVAPFFYGHYVTRVSDLKSSDPETDSKIYEEEIRAYQETHGTEKEPNRDRITASFQGLARVAAGVKRIGTAILDVDHFGMLRESLPNETLSHRPTLSRSLTCFFSLYLNRICERGDIASPIEELDRGDRHVRLPFALPLDIRRRAGREVSDPPERRMLNVVYSGGEDLLVVGSWNDTAEFAFDLYHCFRAFTGFNPDLSLSGGMVVRHPGYPFYRMAAEARAGLVLAKESDGRCEDTECSSRWVNCPLRFGTTGGSWNCSRKDRVALFYDPVVAARARQIREKLEVLHSEDERIRMAMKWQEAAKQVEGLVIPLTRIAPFLSGAFLNRVRSIARTWQEENFFYLPQLERACQRARAGLQGHLPGEEREDWEAWGRVRDWLFQDGHLSLVHPFFSWVQLLTRGEDD